MDYQILKRTIIALILCAVLVSLGYFYADRPAAEFAYNNLSAYGNYFKWMTYIPAVLGYAVPIVIIVLILKRVVSSRWSEWNKLSFVMAVNLLVTSAIKDELKFVFGRYWPATWINNNPSWLNDHAYGFHFFHSGTAYQSFPSGHAAVIFAVMSILWIVRPKLRWLSVLLCAMVICGLLVMYYHFISDIVTGAFLGCITGMYAVKLANLKPA